MNNKILFVQLTGGLGNQLFQIAAALSTTKNKVVTAASIGVPRITNGTPDLYLFHLPERISLDTNQRRKSIVIRSTNLLMRWILGQDGSCLRKLNLITISMIYTGLISIHFRRLIFPFVSSNVGYVNIENTRCNLLIGYFQSWRYLENRIVFEELMRMQPIKKTAKYQRLMDEMLKVNPIIIHIRLGDYLDEKHFGVPSEEYYLKALSTLDPEHTRPVWIFSNDRAKCAEIFPTLFQYSRIMVDDSGLDSAQTLELMRYGSGFVISNSSFSWWAASLRHRRDAVVVSPEPWFKGMPEPIDLIPPEWIRVRVPSHI